MRRVLRATFAILSILFALLLGAVAPFGNVVSAAPPTTICAPSEGGGADCALAISAPESVAAGKTFTVTVAITDFEGNVVPPNDPCSSKVVVTLNVFISEGPPFATYTANASNGIATFTVGPLPPNEGTYSVELDASAVQSTGNCFYDSDFTSVTVVTVPAGQNIFPCPTDETCVQAFSGSGSAATLFANTGTFSDVFFEGLAPGEGCAGTPPVDSNGVLTFTYIGGSQKTIVFAVAPFLVNKGIAHFNICWISTNPFTPLGGGSPVTTGLLPDCTKNSIGPCILFRNGTQHDGAFIGVSAPPTDPKGYAG